MAPGSAPPTPVVGVTPFGGVKRPPVAESLAAAAADGEGLRLFRCGVSFLVAVVLVGLVACSAVAGFESEALEEPASISAPVARRLAAATVTRRTMACRSAQPGEPCYEQVLKAMTFGIKQSKDTYLGLSEKSGFTEFQAFLALDPHSGCPRPCFATDALVKEQLAAQDKEDKVVSAMEVSVMGYPASDRLVAQGSWCSVEEPQPGWALNNCGKASGLKIKVLTYNLFWWNLFGRRDGNGGSAGRVIKDAHANQPFDFMGFQECEDVQRVLRDAGLQGDFEAIPGPHAMCVAYRQSAWLLLSNGTRNVGEDRWDQWYGTRAGMWVRLQHKETGQGVFFINHHGPLPVDTGGMCGGEATAFNLLKLIASSAQADDVIILVGDFNAGPQAQTLKSLQNRMHPLHTGKSFGGVDNVFSSCQNVVGTRNLGSGGSDHDALETVLQL